MILIFACVIVLLLGAAGSARATTYALTTSGGSWNTTTVWSPNGTPGATDTVYLPNSKTVSVTNAQSCGAMICSNGTVTITTSGNLNIVSNFFGASGNINVGSSGSNLGTLSCSNMTFYSSVQFTIYGTVNVSGTVDQTAGSPNMNSQSGCTYNYSGVSQSMLGGSSQTLYNLLFTGSGTVSGSKINQISSPGCLTIGPNVTMTGLTANTLANITNNGTLGLGGSVVATTVLYQGTNATLYATNNFSSVTTPVFTTTSNTVVYTGSGKTPLATAYYNLGLIGGGTDSLNAGLSVNAAGTLTISNATLAQVNLTGLNCALTLGGTVEPTGTYGGSGSGCATTNGTYFASGRSAGQYVTVPAAACTPPAITSQPAAQTVCSGASATFSVTTGVSSPSYQWYRQALGAGAFSAIASATNASYTNTSVTVAANNNDNYYCQISVSGGCSTNSSTNSLTVYPVSNAGTIAPASTNICAGTATTFTLSGSVGTIQWQLSTTGAGAGFTNVTGATGTSYTTPSLSVPVWVRTVVTSGPCSSATSSAASVGINQPPTIASQPAGTSVCPGATAAFSFDAGATTSPQYQWYVIPSGGGVTNSATGTGSTSATYTGASTATGNNGDQYFVVISSGVSCGNAVTSSVATLTVRSATFTASIIGGNQTNCANANQSFTVSTSLVGTPAYQWIKNGSNLSDVGNISGSVSATLTLTNLAATNAGTYTCLVTDVNNPTNCSVTTAAVTLNVDSAPSINVPPSNQEVCQGSTATFMVTANGGDLTYQWMSNSLAITGATNSSYTTAVASLANSGDNYSVTITNGCGVITSSNATVTVDPTSQIGSVSPSSSTICSGSGTTLGLTGTVVGAIQWQKSSTSAGSGFTDIAGATSASLNTGNLTQQTWFRARATSGACSPVTNSAAVVNINVSPTATVTGSAGIFLGSSNSIQAALTGTGPWNVQWSDGVAQNGVTSPATRTVSPTANTTYTVTNVVDTATGCSGSGTGSATVQVGTAYEFTASSATIATPGGSTTVTVKLVDATGALVSASGTRNLTFSGLTAGNTGNTPTINNTALNPTATVNSVAFSGGQSTTLTVVDWNGNFGASQTLAVSDNANAISTSNTGGAGILVNVNGGVVTQLIWATPPPAAFYPNTVMSPSPVIKTADQYGNPSTNGLGTFQNINVRLAGSGVLSGVTNYDIGLSGTNGANGIVVCSGLQINTTGAGDQLIAAPGNGLAPSAISGIAFWLDPSVASSVTTNGSGNVTQISDLSSNGLNFTSSGTVTYATNINGLRALTFPGGNSIANVLANTAYRNTTTTITFFHILRHSSSGLAVWEGSFGFSDNANADYAANDSFGLDNNDASGISAPLTSVPWRLQVNNAVVGAVSSGVSLNTALGSLIEVEFTGSGGIPANTGNVFFNGRSIVSGSSSITLNLQRANLGSRLDGAGGQTLFSGNNLWNGELGEQICYNAALTAAQRALVEIYLTNKWAPVITSNGVSTFNVVAPAPAQLAFSNSPANPTVAGATLGGVGGIVVQMLDTNGLPATNSLGTNITVSLAGGSGTLLGTLTQATAANGQATFNNLNITSVGTFALVASVTGLTPATNGAFTVIPGPAAMLAFVQQPLDGQLDGSSFYPYPTVEVEDAYGNVRVDDGTNVTLTAAPGTSLFFENNTAVTGNPGAFNTPATNGIAVFDDLVAHGSSQTAQLLASAPGLESATSDPFEFNGLPVDAVEFTTQPTNNTAGAILGEVDVLATTEEFPQANVGVTLSLASGIGHLNGTVSVQTDGNGVAHFTDLYITNAGTFTLQAVSGGATVTSDAFTIVAAGAAQLIVSTQPSATATAGVAFATQPVVQVRDAYANVVTNSSAAVAATELSGGNINATSNNSVSFNAVLGTVTCSALYLTNAGTDQLVFTSSGLMSATSSLVTVTANVPGVMTLRTQPSSTAMAGVAFAQQPVVSVADVYGNSVTNGTVVSASASSGNVQGTTNLTTSSGVASFSNLALTNAGSSTLRFVSGSVSVTSSAINVSAGNVTLLIWSTPPGNATNSLPFGIQPVIKTADQYGNPSTNGLGATQLIMVSKTAGSGDLGGIVNYDIGLASTNGANGSVTCSGLSVSAGGAETLAVAAGNGLVPTNIAGVSFWLDPSVSNSVTVVGGKVTQINDLSTNNLNFTSSGAVTYPTTIGGHNALALPGGFGGANTLVNTNYRNSGKVLTFFHILRHNTTTGLAVWEGSFGFSDGSNDDSAGSDSFGVDNNDTNGISAPLISVPWRLEVNSAVVGAVSSGVSLNNSVGSLVEVEFTGANVSPTNTGNIFFNGQTMVSGSSSPTFGLKRVSLGGRLDNNSGQSPGNTLYGDLGEQICYNAALTPAQRVLVEVYLTNKWAPVITTGSAVNFNVAPGNAASVLTASPSMGIPGTTVNLTNVVSAAAPATNLPTGTVVFATNGTPFATNILVAGLAYTNALLLPHGSNTVTAQYSGDANLNPAAAVLGVIIDTPPVPANNFKAQTLINTPLSLSVAKLLVLATDADHDVLSVPSVTATSTNGSAVSLSSGTILYTPTAGYTGLDLVNYTLNDGYTNVTGSIFVRVVNNTNHADLISSSLNGDGSLTLRFAGIPASVYHVQVASNLSVAPVTWLDLTDSTNTDSASGVGGYTDSSPTNFTPKYYRSVSP